LLPCSLPKDTLAPGVQFPTLKIVINRDDAPRARCSDVKRRFVQSSGDRRYAMKRKQVRMPTITEAADWTPLFSLVVYGIMVLALMGVLLVLTSRLGQRRSTDEKLRPYESGIVPTGTARLRYPVPFFLVAIFLLVFDVEGAFIFAWAVAGRELGWSGWIKISVFIVLLLVGLIYIWRKGGLDWGAIHQKK
jgi:NADH-quinone oxidoreductase subunit A